MSALRAATLARPALLRLVSTRARAEQIESFRRDGFLVVPEFLPLNKARDCANRLEDLFAGKFETGVYPDEWNWRKGMSFPDLTREICNAWKSDKMIASVVLSSQIGEFISLIGGWPGMRIAQDDVWMKPPGGKEIAHHRDVEYFDFLDPTDVITCWIALEDTTDRGTLEYVRGSHRWAAMERERAAQGKEYRQQRQPFFTSQDYLRDMLNAAERAGVPEKDIEIVKVNLPPGGATFHHMGVWHGSGKNVHASESRKALAIHAIPSHTKFRPTGVHYTYGRYKRYKDDTMDENFFPIVWTKSGHRSECIKEHCPDDVVLRTSASS